MLVHIVTTRQTNFCWSKVYILFRNLVFTKFILLILKKFQDGKCKVLKLNESSDDTPFSITVIDGTQHIISPLNLLLNNPNFKVILCIFELV